LKRVIGEEIAISDPMIEALQVWSRMYENKAEWLSNDVKSLNLPAAIAGEIARAVTIEMEVEIIGGGTAGESGETARSSRRADFLAAQMERVSPQLREKVEYGAAKGGLMFKPYVRADEIGVDYVQADQFYPLSFDSDGNIDACVFSDTKRVGNKWFTRLEIHRMTAEGYIVRNKAFRSDSRDTLGVAVSLAEVGDWADLAEEALITGIDRPLFAYFRYPLANNVDPVSPLGVSCYARAVDLIRQADELWSDLLWEFDSGKRALYVDETAFDKNSEGKPILPHKRLYRTLKLSSQVGKDEMFEEWSPDLREENLLRGLNAILKRIEFTCGLAYGTLSDPEEVDKTATEILSSKQRSAATFVDTQKALAEALDQLIYAMNAWCDLEKLAPAGGYDTAYTFDDSLITDRDKQFSQDQQVVGMGAMGKVEFRMRTYGESEEVARQKVAEAQAEAAAATNELFPEEE
jgi:A118 family predicted phage portal protein